MYPTETTAGWLKEAGRLSFFGNVLTPTLWGSDYGETQAHSPSLTIGRLHDGASALDVGHAPDGVAGSVHTGHALANCTQV